MNGRITSVVLVVALLGAVTESATDPSSLFNLTILHTNDVHCRFEQANKYGGSCTDEEAAAGNILVPVWDFHLSAFTFYKR